MNKTSEVNNTCTKCNKFFGTKEMQGLCSVCFKQDGGVKKMSIDETKPTEEKSIEVALPEEKIEEVIKPTQSNRFNCWKCDKKVGYLGFKCKCNYIFCASHRHFTDHACDFDYKTNDRAKLNNQDCFVDSKKVEKI